MQTTMLYQALSSARYNERQREGHLFSVTEYFSLSLYGMQKMTFVNTRFDTEEFVRVACEAMGARSCNLFTKLEEGKSSESSSVRISYFIFEYVRDNNVFCHTLG